MSVPAPVRRLINMLFSLIFLLLNIVVLCGCIMGKHYGLTVVAGVWFVIYLMIMGNITDAGFMSAFSFIGLGAVVLVVSFIGGLVVIGGADLIKNN